MRQRAWGIELKPRQRALFVDTLPDAANLALGGRVFGQFVATGEFSVGVAVLGAALWVTLIGFAVAFAAVGDV